MKFSQGFRDTEVGKILNDWKIKKLGCFGDFRNGVNFSREDFGKGYPVINVKNLFSGRYATTKDLAEIKKGTIKNINLYSLQRGDILFARSSVKASGAGQVAMINDLPNNSTLFSGFIIRFRNNSYKLLSNNFINYLLRSNIYRKYLTKIAIGTSIINLTQGTLSNIPIILPPLNEQNWIVNILTDLDRKIELNNQINKNLETMAQEIFKHWFVDFEFPDENGGPYKSSGGEMMDSELDLIPKEWKINRLHELTKRNKQKIKDIKDWENKKLIDLSIMPQFSFCITNFEKGNKLKTNIYKLSEFDILFGSIRPYFGKAGFSPINGVVAGTIFSYLPVRKDLYSYILCLTTSKSFIDFTVKYSRGTKMPIINWDDFVSYKVVVPENDKLIESFNNMIMPLLKEIKENINMNQNLSDIRDVLLPKLMSGEIQVPINNIKEGE